MATWTVYYLSSKHEELTRDLQADKFEIIPPGHLVFYNGFKDLNKQIAAFPIGCWLQVIRAQE